MSDSPKPTDPGATDKSRAAKPAGTPSGGPTPTLPGVTAGGTTRPPSQIPPAGAQPKNAQPSTTPASAPGRPAATSSSSRPVAPSRPGRSPAAVLSAIGFLLLLAGGVWLYEREEALFAAQAEIDPGRLSAIENELRAQSQQITQLNQRPVPQPVNVSPLQDRLAALEKEVQGLSQQSAPAGPQQQADSAALRNRIAALETRLGDVAQQVTQTAGAAGQAGDAAQRAIAQAQQATAQAQQAADAAKQAAAQASAAAQDANRAVQSAGRADRVQQAIAALEAGQPLGQITNAPPALQQFATTPPPTEAQLRLAFPAAAEAAAEASKPRTDNLSLGDRMWLRIRSLVTVRQGDKVVVGSPAITVLDAARAKLNAGDLAGAVAELDRLDGAAAQAMADWLGQAKSLLAARAALVSMAHT